MGEWRRGKGMCAITRPGVKYMLMNSNMYLQINKYIHPNTSKVFGI